MVNGQGGKGRYIYWSSIKDYNTGYIFPIQDTYANYQILTSLINQHTIIYEIHAF